MSALSFRTSDGYTLHFVGGYWVDSLDPASVDMMFADRDGTPLDAYEEPLSGSFLPRSPDELDDAIPAELAERISAEHFRTETLESRGRDALDFRDVSVEQIRAALADAYRAGLAAARKGVRS